jgi:hypothetical protein
MPLAHTLRALRAVTVRELLKFVQQRGRLDLTGLQHPIQGPSTLMGLATSLLLRGEGRSRCGQKSELTRPYLRPPARRGGMNKAGVATE